MRSIREVLTHAVSNALTDALGTPPAALESPVAQAANPQFGDYQVNAAMALARKLGAKPRDLAQKIVDALEPATGEMLEPPEIAGPGFINLRLRREYLERCLMAIPGARDESASGPDAGSAPGVNDRMGIDPLPDDMRQVIVVDYSSPNVAKQMHVGHLRSTIIGDTIARVLDFEGHHVIRQNHLGDWGTQFGMVILGIWHLCMAQRHGEGVAYLQRMTSELREAHDDAVRLRAALDTIVRRHQEDLDADADGALFHRFLQSFDLDFDGLLDSYRFVNAVEKAAAGAELAVVHPASGQRTPVAELSRYVAAMLQGVEREREQELAAWRRAREASLSRCAEIYRRLGVLLTEEDVRGESFFEPFLPGIVEELRARLSTSTPPADGGLRAVCRDDQDALCVFLENPDGTPAFKGPRGDPLPLIVQKSDGAYLYATTDLAAALYRISHPVLRPIELHSATLREALRSRHGGLGGDRILYVVGAPQRLHFQMFFPVVRALGWTAPTRPGQAEVRLEHVMFGSVLGDDRKMLRTRSGESVKLEDLLNEAVQRARALIEQSEADPDKRRGLGAEEMDRIAETVGIAAVKYADLCQNRNTDYVFSWDKMLATQGNAGPYMLYAYAKIRSIYRKGGLAATEAGAQSGAGPIRLEHAAERALGLRILQLAEAIDSVSETLLPNILCEYLFDLAGTFNVFYDACPVLQAPDPATRDSRLRLCGLTARALRLGLGLLGIPTLERM